MSETLDPIIVPTDGSEGATRAARFAATLARATGAGILLVIVHNPEIYALNATGQLAAVGGTILGGLSQSEVDALVRTRFAEPAFAAARAAIGEGVKVATREIWGQTAAEICRLAGEERAGMIVIGSRGRSVFTELLLGSTSSQVLHHAPCPVTVVH